MSQYLRLSFRLLDARFHGRADRGEMEWPPSPLRAFQSLVASAGQRWRDARLFNEYARAPLVWLEGLGSPDIVAPSGMTSASHRIYVPNNHADIVAAAWSGGDAKASIAEHRVEKTVRSTRLTNGDTIHYLWPAVPGHEEHIRVLNEIAREVSHLGWGVDQVAASLTIIEAADSPSGEWWRPVENGGVVLRIPRPQGPAGPSTLTDLRRKHAEFSARLGPTGFRPVPPLTAFDTVGYRRDTDFAPREWVAFRISSVDPDAPNPSFDTPRRARDVAAWVRHATSQVCAGWPFGDPVPFVHGHVSSTDSQPLRGEGADSRFMYLPLPTINHTLGRVESIRRVLIAAPPGFEDHVQWVRRRLQGHELVRGDSVNGLLNTLPDSDWVLGRYIGPKQGARTWYTVTPVVWPGHDDRDPEKADRLLRRAFVNAGLSEEVVGGITELAWRNVGFQAGLSLASQYELPDHLTGIRYHVRVRFAHPVRGPLAVGSGRYRGLGVFATE